MIIAHNMVAQFTDRQLNINTRGKNKIAEKLASGYRINRAADDAAGLSISEKMRGQIRGLERGAQNVQEGINFCNVADGALNEVHSILGRIKELSVQAANDTNVEADREAINEEITQLKKEINRIARSTEYNTYPIFCADFEIEFSDDIQVIQIFDANNGDPSDPDSYGGIIINGSTRIAWKDIDPNMVYTDATTGKTMFNEGEYTVNAGGYDLKIECKDGSKPPEITVEFPLSASAAGITVAGTLINWTDIVNDDGESILNHMGEEGFYHFKYGNGEGGFSIPACSDLSEIIDGINDTNIRYARKYLNIYNGYYKAQAVDIVDTGSNMRVSNSIFSAIVNNSDLDALLQADDTGVWVVDAAGNEVAGSKKSWSDLGIDSWDSGSFISDTKTYKYEFKDGNYDIKFNFTLVDETSMDSVIEGINNAHIQDTAVKTNNSTSLDFTAGGSVLDGKITGGNNKLDIYEEAALGRDFDIKNAVLGSEKLEYDDVTNQFKLTYTDATTGQPALEYISGNVTSRDTLQNNAEAYLQYLIAQGVKEKLSGAGYVPGQTLTDVLGGSKVTGSGHLSENIVIDKSVMNTTKNIANGTYPAAKLDFSGLGTDYEWYDLLGTGFNSTCKTCNNHYSVMFVYGGTDNTTSQGYGYQMEQDGQENYTLQIDLKSMVEKGITTGEQLADAMVDIMRESKFDFHFTQYASDGANFYICDNRPQTTPAPEAKFDTEPYEIKNSVIDVSMVEKNSNKNVNLQYTYDMTASIKALVDVKNSINAVGDAQGSWVEDGNGGYKKFNPADYPPNPDGTTNYPPRFSITVTNTVPSWEAFYDGVMKDIADNSSIKIETDDFAYVDYVANERFNQATISTFEFKIEDNKTFWIQAGANAKQGIALEWDNISTYVLGIGSQNVKDFESAEELIGKVDKAVEKVSEIRSTFGAYTNRLEHAYNLDTNTAENLQAAESRIRDLDMAKGMVEFSKHSILEQAAQAMLAQANQSRQGILNLLR